MAPKKRTTKAATGADEEDLDLLLNEFKKIDKEAKPVVETNSLRAGESGVLQVAGFLAGAVPATFFGQSAFSVSALSDPAHATILAVGALAAGGILAKTNKEHASKAADKYFATGSSAEKATTKGRAKALFLDNTVYLLLVFVLGGRLLPSLVALFELVTSVQLQASPSPSVAGMSSLAVFLCASLTSSFVVATAFGDKKLR